MRPSDSGYLIIQSPGGDAEDRHVLEAGRRGLKQAGWRSALAVEDLEVFVGPRRPPKVRLIHRRCVLVGTYRPHGQALSALIGGSRSPEELARAAAGGGWGRYVLAWRTDAGDLAMLRDPSGAVDCLTWRRGGLRLTADQPPPEADVLLPATLAIDWERLGEIAEQPGLVSDQPPLKGLTAVAPGEHAVVGRALVRRPVWRPADIWRTRRVDPSPQALRSVVDEAVAAEADGQEGLIGEISGGLDSAVVSSSLAASGRADAVRFVNYYGDWVEGDERAYALAAARMSGLCLEVVRKPVAPITLEQLEPLGWGVRPALQGVDTAYDQEMADRLRKAGATGLVTGQGGDAVFFQAPDPQVAVDRRRRRGWKGVEPGYWAEVGRWTRHSIWSVAAVALGGGRARPARGRDHPWLENCDDLPPGKRGQILRLANCQLFWGDCQRARAADLVHPLLSQPVMEHALAVPADQLLAGVRDRGLARLAFADRLPTLIAERRDKGDLSVFYGHVLLSSLPVLRPFLMEGRLTEHRLLDRVELERDLSPQRLMWSPDGNRPLLLGVLESWARHWGDRIERRRAEGIRL
ncbi:asparagine synthase C-terminal domain-containing protein [Brevundimonas faecalis]|uniref:Asparagine synthase (Glutamine-hydrolyzing) n=1 Tax=Brevundimonas faecalis TaxID=947378 RepID=A0ABV2R7U1_9CAUL